MTPTTIRLTEIDVPTPLLAYSATRTVELAKAIRAGQAIVPLVVVERNGKYALVEGKDEFAALRLVGSETAEVRFVRSQWRERHLRRGAPHEI